MLDPIVAEERDRTEALIAGLAPEVRQAVFRVATAIVQADS